MRLFHILMILALAAGLTLAGQVAPARADDAPLAPTHTNSIGMEFALIPAGQFQMGATDEEVAAVCARGASRGNEQVCRELRAHEQPRLPVRIEQPFYLGKYEVTQAQWREVMGDDPGEFEGDELPVHGVSWGDAEEFIRRLNAREKHERYRLPTEAEWEHAARAGTTTAYFFGDDPAELGRYAWHGRNAGGRPHPVGQKAPNPWGLFDIYGNVWEWTCSIYYPQYYKYLKWPTCREYDSRIRTSLDPSDRVLRGCSWANPDSVCRSAERHRSWMSQQGAAPYFGFRLVMEARDEPEPAQASRPKRPARPKSPQRRPEAPVENAGTDAAAATAPLSPECMNQCFADQSACLAACAEEENCPALCGNLQSACLADCEHRATATEHP